MAKKKQNQITETIIVDTEPSLFDQPIDTAESEAPVSEKDQLLAEIRDLAAKFDEHVRFAEFAKQNEVKETIAEKIEKYQKLCEQECFEELKGAEKPLFEAAKKLRYDTYTARPKKDEAGIEHMEVAPATAIIDPMRLHKRVEGGIGEDKYWYLMVERINFCLTARRCIELGIDPKRVNDSFAIADEARKLEGFKQEFGGLVSIDQNAANNLLLQDLQKVVDAMIGSGYVVPAKDVLYLLSVFSKKDSRKSLSVTCSNHKYMRQYLLEICHQVITNADITVNFKEAKRG